MGRGSGGGDGRTSGEVAFWNKLGRFGMMRSRRGRFTLYGDIALSDLTQNPRRRYPQNAFKNPIFGPLESGQTESGARNFWKNLQPHASSHKSFQMRRTMIKIANDLDSSQLLDIFFRHFPKICTSD